MGHLWSRRSTRNATSGHHVLHGHRTRSARNEPVRNDREAFPEDKQTASQAASSQRHYQNKGYGQFRVSLESLLTRSHAEQLATWFGYSPANVDKIKYGDNPGRIVVQLMDERGEINPTDILQLTNALEHNTIRLDGVALKVKEAFRNYQSNIYQTTVADAKTVFLRELRQKYENQYDAVQPIPYIRDRLYCVDKVFVEGGIEYFKVGGKTRSGDSWGKLESYKDIFHNANVTSVRRILEGEPGFGKSTFTLQVAYDWCNSIAGSVSDKYEILILLRLKQLGGVISIFEAIKRFILPKDSTLNESDIQQILRESRSVLIILDGFDEYPDRDGDVSSSDVWNIIRMDMFQAFDVILTTRTACLPKDPAPQTKRIRLTGFGDRAQDEYIRRAVVGNDEDAAKAIKRRLLENPILADLCQVPLFFVMFVHLSHERKDLEKFKSVTSFFRFMIWCFHHHMKNKTKDENVLKHSSFEEDHLELDRVAFEGLIRKEQQLVWGKQELCERLGQDFYDHYVRLGILVEEEVLDLISPSESPVVTNFVKERTEVRFFHKLFCEWYAAQFLGSYIARRKVRFVRSNVFIKLYHKGLHRKDISDILSDLDPFDLQYVFRFACGLNPYASGKIIKYLQNKENAKRFAVLCILEKEGNTDTILDSVRDLCSGAVEISNSDTLLFQRSTIQLLDIATTNGISIASVMLDHCCSRLDGGGGNHLQLKSNLVIPVLSTLNKLTIRESGKQITSEELTCIFQYSSKCLALKQLELHWCLLPQSVLAESISVLKSRNVKVAWYPQSSIHYQLNLKSCLWELVDGDDQVLRVMTDDHYQSELKEFKQRQEETQKVTEILKTLALKVDEN